MKPALRFLRIVQGTLLLSLLLFLALPEFLQIHPTAAPSPLVFDVVTGLCIWMILGMFFLRKKIVSRAEQRIIANPEDKAAWTSWQKSHVIALAVCEALALYGLKLRILGFGLGQVAPFYLAGVGLMLYMTPRPPLDQL